MDKEYAADRAPLIDRTIKAGATANLNSKTFYDNLDRLTGMGFSQLALQLLDMGGPEAETIAAQAVKSAAKARQLQGQLATSAGLSAREDALRAMLSGSSGAMAAPAGLGSPSNRHVTVSHSSRR